MASKIMIIRHGEKPSGDDSLRGVSESGHHDANELVVRGWQRAGALVRFFAPLMNQFANPALAIPDEIFAVAVDGHIQSFRAQHTVFPLAQVLCKPLNVKYAKNEEPALAEAAVACHGVVLISWEHKLIPSIINHIVGNDTTCPQKWPDSRFDLVWVLDQHPHTMGWKFIQVAQMLLPDDSPYTI